MSEPGKFVLKDALWRNLPSQYLEDSLLCSRASDAVKWSVVSKDINEIIEENRAKMPRFKRDFIFDFGGGQKIHLRATNNPETTYEFDCSKPPLSSKAFFLKQGGKESRKFRLCDPSTAGVIKFLKYIITTWYKFDKVDVYYRPKDFEILRPLAEDGACFHFHLTGTYDGGMAKMFLSLRIRRLFLLEGVFTDAFCDQMANMPLEEVYLNKTAFLKITKFVPVIRFPPFIKVIPYQEFKEMIVTPWRKGDLPYLRNVILAVDHGAGWNMRDYNYPDFKPVANVPNKTEAEVGSRFFRLVDKRKKHAMEVHVTKFPRKSCDGVMIRIVE